MKPSEHTGKRYLTLVKAILFYILSVVVFATIARVTQESKFPDHLSIFITSILSFLLVFAFMRWDVLTFKDIGLYWKRNSFFIFTAGVGLGTIMVALQAIILIGFKQVKFEWSGYNDFNHVAMMILLYFLVAIREELIFRSYMLRSINIKFGSLFSLIFVTCIFVLEHVISGSPLMTAIIGAGLGGLLFGISALATKSIILPIGLHFSWNLTQWALGFKNNAGIWHEVVLKGKESSAEPFALFAYTVVMLLAIVTILFFFPINSDSARLKDVKDL